MSRSSAHLLGQAFGLLATWFILYRGTVWFLGLWRLRYERIAPIADQVNSSHLQDVSSKARSLRWDGRVLHTIHWTSLYMILLGSMYFLETGGSLGWLALTMSGLILGFGVSALWRHRGHVGNVRKIAKDALTVRFLRVLFPVVMSLIFLGLSLFFFGWVFLTRGETITALNELVELSLTTVQYYIMLSSVVALLIGLLFLRWARNLSRTIAAELLAIDARPPVLYLRSFDDDKIRVRTVSSGRKPFIDILAPRLHDKFDEIINWSLSTYGPVIAVGRPGSALRTLGPALERLPEKEWQKGVSNRVRAAGIIVATIGQGEGFGWEVDEIVRQGAIDRTIFLFPPGKLEDVREGWAHVAGSLSKRLGLVQLPVDAGCVLTATVNLGRTTSVTTADRRDEAAYKAAISQSINQLRLFDQRIKNRIENKLKGLGGWLILVGIGMFLSTLRILYEISTTQIPIFKDNTWKLFFTAGSEIYSPTLGSLVIGESIFNIGMVLASIFIICLFFAKHYLFPKCYIAIVVISLIFIPLDAFLVSLFLPNEPMFDPITTKQFIFGLVGALIFVPYMLKSKRVKATFIKKFPQKLK